MVAGVGKLPEYVKFFSGFLLVGNHGVTTALREQIMNKCIAMFLVLLVLWMELQSTFHKFRVVHVIDTHIQKLPSLHEP